MKKGTKVALFLSLGVLAALFATCGGIAAWLYANSERLTEQGKAVMREGAHFGGGKEAPACVDEALRRLSERHLGIVEEATNKVFLESCLGVATRPPGFCEGVPPRDELLKTAAWLLERCEAAGHPNDQPCTRLLGAVQESCVGPR